MRRSVNTVLLLGRHVRTLLIGIVVAVALNSQSFASGHREHTVEISFGGGISSPTDDYAKVAAIGSAYSVAFGYTPRSSVTLGVEYGHKANNFSEPGKYLARHELNMSIQSAKYVTSHTSIFAKFLATGRPSTLYLRASIGKWKNESTVTTLANSYSATNKYTGFLMGLGFQVDLFSRFAGFGEIAYSGFHQKGQEQNSDIQILLGLQWVISRKS